MEAQEVFRRLWRGRNLTFHLHMDRPPEITLTFDPPLPPELDPE